MKRKITVKSSICVLVDGICPSEKLDGRFGCGTVTEILFLYIPTWRLYSVKLKMFTPCVDKLSRFRNLSTVITCVNI